MSNFENKIANIRVCFMCFDFVLSSATDPGLDQLFCAQGVDVFSVLHYPRDTK